MKRTSLAAVLLATFAVPALAAAAPGKDRTETLIAAFKKVKKDDGKLTEVDKSANAKLFAELDGYLDFDTLTSKPIAPRAARLTPAETTAFKAKFKNLIRLIAYPNAGTFFRKAAFALQPEKSKGDGIQVPLKVRLPEEDMETVVEFVWAKTGGVLKIQDVLFDGDSLVKDYQNQLSKLIDKSGVPGLMKALDDRLAELGKSTKG